jgi:hypothetical protein
MQDSDLDEVIRIENQVFHPPWPKEAFMEAPCTYSWVICEEKSCKDIIIYQMVRMRELF